MKFFVLLILSLLLLSACQSTIKPTSLAINQQLYLDNDFFLNTSLDIESEEDIFFIDDEMRLSVQQLLAKNQGIIEKTKALLTSIFEKDGIALTYEGNANLTAKETFHTKQANCLSLTILAYVLAKEIGLSAYFQKVDIPEYWIRNGEFNMLTGHVNLKVSSKHFASQTIVYGDNDLQIDFDPAMARNNFPKKVISKKDIIAMFYNNKGAEALVKQQYSVAYQYLKAATMADSKMSRAWGNLGVLYRLTGHLVEAEQIYRFALKLDNNNLTVYTNLSLLLSMQGKEDEAQTIENKIFNLRSHNPYYFALLADEAFYKHNYRKAIKYYKRAIRLNNTIHEFYFGLAKVYYKNRQLPEAKRAIKKALQLNSLEPMQQEYLAKLNFLNHQH